MLATMMAPLALSFFTPPCAPVALGPPRPRLVGARAQADAASDFPFDAALRGILDEARESSMEKALDAWESKIDDNFMPTLSSRIDAAQGSEPDPELALLMTALQLRTEARFKRARDQLQELLGAGEINKMDAALCKLVRENEVDAGLFYVLVRNMEDAREAGQEQTAQIFSHLHTRLQEELEKRSEPALALLHKLTRTDDSALRGRILRHYMVPATSVKLPDGQELPLQKAAPAQVAPLAFAAAVEGALDKVLSMSLDRAVIEATAEDIRVVAKEAHRVVAEAYPPEEVLEFQDALTPAFSRALPNSVAK